MRLKMIGVTSSGVSSVVFLGMWAVGRWVRAPVILFASLLGRHRVKWDTL